jgi:hypothetical protein
LFPADREPDSDDEGDTETESDSGDVTQDPLFASKSSLFDSSSPVMPTLKPPKKQKNPGHLIIIPLFAMLRFEHSSVLYSMA